MELKLEELNLAELVTAISEEMRSLVEQKNLTMLVNLNLHNPISSRQHSSAADLDQPDLGCSPTWAYS